MGETDLLVQGWADFFASGSLSAFKYSRGAGAAGGWSILVTHLIKKNTFTIIYY